MFRKEDVVEKAIEDVQDIRESIDMLVKAKDKAILLSHGITSSSSSSSSEGEASNEHNSDVSLESFVAPEKTPTLVAIDYSTLPLRDIVEKSKSNMFQMVEEMEAHLQRSLTSEELDNLLEKTLSFQEHDSYLIHQSYRALLASGAQSVSDGQCADLVNGLIITDSESEDPEMWSQDKSLEEEKNWLKSKEQL